MKIVPTLAFSLLTAASGQAPLCANPVEEAQKFVIEVTNSGKNIFADGCSKYTTRKGKAVCFLKDYPAAALIAYTNAGKKASLLAEYKTIREISGWHIRVVTVGSEFMDPLPCSQSAKKFECGGFTEERVDGTEVYWAAYQDELINAIKSIDECSPDNPTYVAKVEKAYTNTASVDNLKSPLSKLVKDKSENWREELSGDVASVGQTFAEQKAAILDLQTFVVANGEMVIFDVEELLRDKKSYTCWSAALRVFASVIAGVK